MPISISIAAVARMEPPFFVQRFGGFLSILEIAAERRAAAYPDFAIRTKLHFHTRRSRANGGKLYVAVVVHRRRLDFRRAVQILQLGAHRAEETQHVRAECRSRRKRMAHPRHTDLVSQRLEDSQIP